MAWRRMPLFSWSATRDLLRRCWSPARCCSRRSTMLLYRPQLRRRLLRRRRGRRADPLPAPELDLLHRRLPGDRAAGRRRDLGDRPDVLAQAAVLPPRGRRLARRGRRPRLARLDAEHVHGADPARLVDYFAMPCALALLVPLGVIFFNWIATLWGARCTCARRCSSRSARSARSRFGLAGELAHSVIPVGWQLATRSPPTGHPLRAHRRLGLRRLRGALLLVPEDHRADDGRGPGEGSRSGCC